MNKEKEQMTKSFSDAKSVMSYFNQKKKQILDDESVQSIIDLKNQRVQQNRYMQDYKADHESVGKFQVVKKKLVGKSSDPWQSNENRRISLANSQASCFSKAGNSLLHKVPSEDILLPYSEKKKQVTLAEQVVNLRQSLQNLNLDQSQMTQPQIHQQQFEEQMRIYGDQQQQQILNQKQQQQDKAQIENAQQDQAPLCAGPEQPPVQIQEKQIRQFLKENSKLAMFLKDQLKLPQDQTQQRLLRYFLSNTAYFNHIAGTCKCFSCECGKCKCNYLHKGLNDSYNTVYNNSFQQGPKGELLRMNQDMIQSRPVFALKDDLNSLDYYKTIHRKDFHKPHPDDYVTKGDWHQWINMEPTLIKNSDYRKSYAMDNFQAQTEILPQVHRIVENTPIIGGSLAKKDYINQGPAQKHYNKIFIEHPLQHKSNLPSLRRSFSNSNFIKLPSGKLQDNIRGDCFLTNPNQFLSEHKKGFQYNKMVCCPSQLKK